MLGGGGGQSCRGGRFGSMIANDDSSIASMRRHVSRGSGDVTDCQMLPMPIPSEPAVMVEDSAAPSSAQATWAAILASGSVS